MRPWIPTRPWLPLLFAAAAPAQTPAPAQDPGPPHEPVLATGRTLADPAALARLQQPGTVLFRDDFESQESLRKYFEVRGANEGNARIVLDPALAHAGKGALQLTSRANEGRSSGAGASGWLGDAGHARVHLRYWLKFAADYDQGNLNHTGGHLVAVTGADKWAGMGTAGIRPEGNDRFSSSFEAWTDWGRVPPPGSLHAYTYWMDMRKDRDGHFWGNMLQPPPAERIVPQRGRWTCFELMLRANDPGEANGELAAWVDGALHMHFEGLRLRSTAEVLLKRFGLDVYVHQAVKDNTVWYDDVVVSTGYVGPDPAK